MPESSIPSPYHGDTSYRSLYNPEQLTSMIKFKLRESYVPPELDNAIIGVMFGCVEDLLHQRQQGPHNFSDEHGQPIPHATTFSASLPDRRTGALTEPGDETAQLADANPTPGPWSEYENVEYYGQICEDIPHMIQPELQPEHADYDWLPQQGDPSHPSFYVWSHPDVEIEPAAPQTVPEEHATDPYQDATMHDPASDASGCHGYGLEQYGQGYYQ
ncbi:hypothetical protein MPH_05978 [Macrophomina phaseolina MS6]|uniref:Uncharacterized protein n=1 Tax=Macrophomina phaseolina (strain MS6) TaxID=1126212 RepID=K2SIU9_MACPH|nr:hypothetical protein MPH_05978 [Macrophomina phaseolina MS6]